MAESDDPAADRSSETVSQPTGLTPSQQRTLDALRRSPEPVVFDADFVSDLRDDMTRAVAEFAAHLEDGQEMWVSKHALATVLDCEARYMTQDDFEWSTANAAGTVAHRAIELLIWWRGEPVPVELVDEAMAKLVDEEASLGQWLGALSDADEADLRGRTAVRVTQFIEHFPPLSPRFRPVTEAKVRWPVSGPITLSGKVDLAFGTTAGAESRKVIIDLKTGRPSTVHRQDLGFYALVETLRAEVPPRKVATFYLDAAEAQAEDVTERLLLTAARRTKDGINAMLELKLATREPTKQPGVSCRWCSLAEECNEGQAWLADTDQY